MTEQRQGPLIGPLQIVYQQQDRTVCSYAGQNLHDRSQEDVACLLRRQFHGRSDVGEDASKLRHKTRNLRSVIRERIAEPLSAWPLPQSAFEHFYEGNERNRIIAIVAGTSKDQSTLQQNLTAELRGNAGLSYPWRPGNHHYSSRAGSYILQESPERIRFRIPTHKSRALFQRHQQSGRRKVNVGRIGAGSRNSTGGFIDRKLPDGRDTDVLDVAAKHAGVDASVEPFAQAAIVVRN